MDDYFNKYVKVNKSDDLYISYRGGEDAKLSNCLRTPGFRVLASDELVEEYNEVMKSYHVLQERLRDLFHSRHDAFFKGVSYETYKDVSKLSSYED